MVENWVLKFSIFFLCAACDPRRESREKWKPLSVRRGKVEKIAMEKDSGLIRRRITRTARESTPEPTVKERLSKSSDRETKTQSKESVAADDAKYVVRGILNVGPPSPAGSSSSSGSGSGGYGATSGSQAYRAKILRYFWWMRFWSRESWLRRKKLCIEINTGTAGGLLMMSCWWLLEF